MPNQKLTPAKLYTPARVTRACRLSYSIDHGESPWLPPVAIAKLRTVQRLHLTVCELRLRVDYGLSLEPNQRDWSALLSPGLSDLWAQLEQDAPEFFVSRVVLPALDVPGFRPIPRIIFTSAMRHVRFTPDGPSLAEIPAALKMLEEFRS